MYEEEVQNLVNQGKYAEAAGLAEKHAIHAMQMAALINSKLGNFEQAIKLTKFSIDLEPMNPRWHGNLSYFQGNNLQLEDSLQSIDNALLLTKSPGLFYNRGVILSGLNRVDEAIESYEKELEINPECHKGCFNLGCMLMLKGRYKEAFTLLESRFKYDNEIIEQKKGYGKPDWDGSPNKRVLVYSEQGVGDVLLNIRYLPLMKCTVMGEIQEELIPLLDDLFADGDYDYIVSFNSLPYLLDPELKNIPESPYLFVEKADYKFSDKFNVGLVWAGNPKHQNDISRSCPFKYLEPLTKLTGIQLYSLQKGSLIRNYHGKVVDLGSGDFIDLSPYLDDFLATARFIQGLDLVITVDTAVAHLAGALGKPVWLLLAFCHDHRWPMTGEKTHWYKNMRIFRQSKMDDWGEVIDRVVNLVRRRHHIHDFLAHE